MERKEKHRSNARSKVVFIDIVFHHITHFTHNVEDPWVKEPSRIYEEACIDTRTHTGRDIVLYRALRFSLCPPLRSYTVWCRDKSPRWWTCRMSDGNTLTGHTHTHTARSTYRTGIWKDMLSQFTDSLFSHIITWLHTEIYFYGYTRHPLYFRLIQRENI